VADLVLNMAKGRFVELFTRVDTNDPASSAIIVVPVAAGATTDATIRDYDTLSAALAGLTERTANGWNRKTLTDTDITVAAPDDTNDRYDITIPDQTWTPTNGSDTVSDLLICYDNDTGAGTDANIVVMLCLDFVITPDGSLVTADAGVAIGRAS
jgi:hypothetical protein